MRLRTLAACAAAVGLSATVLAQGPGVRRDGQWEVNVEMNMPGMPMAMPPMKTTQCITKDDANDPKKMVPPQQGRGGAQPKCMVTDSKFEGNKFTYTMKCDPPQAGTMTGEFTYQADSYEGTVKMDMDRSGQPMTMTMKYTGKRLGDCTK